MVIQCNAGSAPTELAPEPSARGCSHVQTNCRPVVIVIFVIIAAVPPTGSVMKIHTIISAAC